MIRSVVKGGLWAFKVILLKLSSSGASRKNVYFFLKKLIACVLAYALLSVETVSVAMTPATPLGSGAAMSPSFTPQELLAQAMLYFLKPKMESALPIQLDPSKAMPTVPNAQLPGGPFHGQRLPLTTSVVSKPLSPGDYEIPVMAYCTQYSVHRPGRGAPSVIAPLTGTQAKTIGDLLWKGTQAGKSPQELQTAAWAIQAGVPYSRMSKTSQQDIDTFVPGARTSLEPGFGIDAPVRTLYNEILTNPRKYIIEYKHAKNIKFPPDALIPNIKITAPSLDQLIAQAGPIGKAYVEAEADQQAIQKQTTDQQHQQENLILHQAPTDPPMPASQGPWTVRVPGRVYMRAITQGGNMQADNILQIRVMAPGTAENRFGKPRLISAAYQVTQASTAAPSVLGLMGAPSDLLSPSYRTPAPVRDPTPVRDPIPTRDPIPVKPVEPPTVFPGEPIPPGEVAPIIEGGEGLGELALLDPEVDLILFSLIAAQALIIALPPVTKATSPSQECPNCPPCKPYPLGTIGYRLDKVPGSRPHYPFTGDHVHVAEVMQSPPAKGCKCFWHELRVTEPPPPPGAVEMVPLQ